MTNNPSADEDNPTIKDYKLTGSASLAETASTHVSANISESANVENDRNESAIITDKAQSIQHEALTLMKGTESGMDRFFGQSYSCPVVARSASQSLIDSFDDKGLWLSSLVQPRHLVSELRQRCALLTSLVVTQWVRQGETHKLKTLGEALLAEPATAITHDSGQIMVMLADLLGILRPQTAQRLLEASRPHLKDSRDLSLMRQAQQWVDLGGLLESTSTDERIFWNRRLREPRGDWDWESADARMALQKLGRLLPETGADLGLIQHTVPGCWWDLWREQRSAGVRSLSGTASSPSPTSLFGSRQRGSFTIGLLLGTLGMACVGWLYVGSLPETDATSPTEQLPRAQPEVAAVEAAAQVEPPAINEPPAPPIRDSLRQLKAVLKIAPEMIAPASLPMPETASPPTNTAESATATKSTLDGKTSGNSDPKALSREKERLAFAQKHPEVKRIFSLTRGSTLREDDGLVQGASSVAPLGSQLHMDLLRMLILDPPEHAEMRRAATRIALRSLPTADVISLFDLCLYAGSPNEMEIKQCLSLLLELSPEGLTEEQIKRLKIMAAGS